MDEKLDDIRKVLLLLTKDTPSMGPSPSQSHLSNVSVAPENNENCHHTLIN